MKRIVVGTFAQCVGIIRKNKSLGDAGYDYCVMEPTTDAERTMAETRVAIGSKITYCHSSKRWNHHAKGNLFTLTLYRDNESHKTDGDYNRAMKPLQT